MDCSLLGSSVHGISQARILKWVAISFSSGSSQPRDWTQSCYCMWILYHWAPGKPETWITYGEIEAKTGGEAMISSAKECKVKLLSCVRLFATPWTIAYHTPPSMGFSRREPWSGLPFPSQRIFLTQGSDLSLPHCKQMLYQLSYQGSPKGCIEQANILGDEFKHIMILMVSILF